MSCRAAGTNGCLDLRCRALEPSEWLRAEWSRCLGYMSGVQETVWPFETELSSLDSREDRKIVR